MSNIYWRHYSGTIIDSSGVEWIGSATPTGKHAISAGGYIGPRYSGADGTNEDENGAHVRSEHRIIGTRPDYDSGTDTRYISVGIAGPVGLAFRAHLYVITED